jgi:hypothetical protein
MQAKARQPKRNKTKRREQARMEEEKKKEKEQIERFGRIIQYFQREKIMPRERQVRRTYFYLNDCLEAGLAYLRDDEDEDENKNQNKKEFRLYQEAGERKEPDEQERRQQQHQFEEWLRLLEKHNLCKIEGATSPNRVIWPASGRFDCANVMRPTRRLSEAEMSCVLLFLLREWPTGDDGRHGFALWLSHRGPKFLKTRPFGYLLELVQLLFNDKYMLCDHHGHIEPNPARLLAVS